MPTECIHFLGIGGHAKVVIDALRASRGVGVDVRLFDDDPARFGSEVAGALVEPAAFLPSGALFHVAIGTNSVRCRRFREIAESGSRPVSIIHPNSAIAPSATLADGIFVAAFAIIAPDSTVGAATIVNHGSVIDHDCVVGSFCHIAPGAVLGGGVTVGEGVLIGAGAVILPSLSLACGVVIGAGAVVTKSIEHAGTFIGSPAREISRG